MTRYNQPYMEHQFNDPKRWAKGMINWFAVHLGKSPENLVNISKVQQDLYRWDAATVAGLNSHTFFETFTPTVSGMPGTSMTPPVDEHFGCIGISLFEANDLSLNSSAWSAGITNAQALQGKLSVIVNGDKKINSIPLTEALAGLTDRGVGFIPLKTWFAWEGNTTIEVIIQFPVPIVEADYNIRVKLEGFGFGA